MRRTGRAGRVGGGGSGGEEREGEKVTNVKCLPNCKGIIYEGENREPLRQAHPKHFIKRRQECWVAGDLIMSKF